MKIVRLLKPLLLCVVILTGTVIVRPVSAADGGGWDDWLDYIAGGGGNGLEDNEAVTINTLSLQEIGEMRVRDIKRRLTRTHGYGADEVGRMLDKKELINALAFEEHKTRERKLEQQKRFLFQRGLIATIVAILVVMCWPLLSHAYEVAMVNFVVYTDRKKFEAKRCFELQSKAGFLGIFLMFVMDGLQVWLSLSILLSWVMRSKYFFPVPSLPVHPAKFMGGQVASGPLAKYGLNIGPMIISWALRFINGQIEKYTGQALARAQRELKKKNRDNETQQEKEERKARKAARKAAKQAAREQADAMAAEAAAAAAAAQQQREMQQSAAGAAHHPPTENPVFEPNQEKPPATYETASVKDFLGDEFDRKNDAQEEEEEEPAAPSALDDID